MQKDTLFIQKCFAPARQLEENRQKRPSLFCQGVFYMQRNLVELFAVHNAKALQVAQRARFCVCQRIAEILGMAAL